MNLIFIIVALKVHVTPYLLQTDERQYTYKDNENLCNLFRMMADCGAIHHTSADDHYFGMMMTE